MIDQPEPATTGNHTTPNTAGMHGSTGLPRSCEWFATCPLAADGVVAHPILGDVPTCRRCADRHDLDLRPAQ